MPWYSFSTSPKDRRKSGKHQPSNAAPQHSADGYGYHGNGVSTITLHRPTPPPFPVQVHPPPPQNHSWNGPLHHQAAMVPQPYVPFGLPQGAAPPPNQISPPPNRVYGPPPSNHPGWASSANLPNPVYPNGRQTKFSSSLHLPSSVSGGFSSASQSMTNLAGDVWNQTASQFMECSSSLYDRMSIKLDNVITCMDEEKFSGNEQDLELQHTESHASRSTNALTPITSKANNFAKVWLYSNSRLPPYLPPVKLYLETYPLLSLAARYSLRVYSKAKGREKNDHIKGSHMNGTKAMVLKSLPIDNMNVIVFAIRGTQTFMDWAVNLKEAPTAPTGFLDNCDNFCHTGFLTVAKAMVRPVAERLRQLLQEDPSRGLASLLITGHSAGGAVAQLLYAHMTSEIMQSELTHLTGFFKRVHCVTFGAPPVSLFPLVKSEAKRHRKSMFFAFANEGDPVVRADRAIVRSLLKLYAMPAPDNPCPIVCPIVNAVVPGMKLGQKIQAAKMKAASWAGPSVKPWKVPSSTLSLGGRIILMREKYGAMGPDDIEACSVTDEMLRDVVYGDPMCHTMNLYARRIEILALRAATARGLG